MATLRLSVGSCRYRPGGGSLAPCGLQDCLLTGLAELPVLNQMLQLASMTRAHQGKPSVDSDRSSTLH